jgi:hypothetical protein
MGHLNIIRADVDENDNVTIALTENAWGEFAGNENEVASQWGKFMGQMVKSIAKTIGGSSVNEEIVEAMILEALNESMSSIEEPPLSHGEPIPGDMDPLS